MIKKELIGAASALALFLSTSVLETNSAAAQGTGAGKSCIDDAPGGSLGHDVCVLSKNGSAEPAGDLGIWLCKMLDDVGILDFLGQSFGECVRMAKPETSPHRD